MKHRTNKFAAAVLAVALASAPMTAAARDSQAKEAGSDFGIGFVTVLANLGYMPVKVVYGVLGGITGAFAFVLSGANREVADGVWVPSLGGDYVLTTGMMKGRERVHFHGVRDRAATEDYDAPAGGDESSGSSF